MCGILLKGKLVCLTKTSTIEMSSGSADISCSRANTHTLTLTHSLSHTLIHSHTTHTRTTHTHTTHTSSASARLVALALCPPPVSLIRISTRSLPRELVLPFCDAHFLSQNCEARRSDKAHASGILFRRPARSLLSSGPPLLLPKVGKRGTLTPRSPTLGKVLDDQLPVKGSVAPVASKSEEEEKPESLPRSCLPVLLVVLSRERGLAPEDDVRTSPHELLRVALALRGRCAVGECATEALSCAWLM
jgi:hypothetical protein